MLARRDRWDHDPVLTHPGVTDPCQPDFTSEPNRRLCEHFAGRHSILRRQPGTGDPHGRRGTPHDTEAPGSGVVALALASRRGAPEVSARRSDGSRMYSNRSTRNWRPRCLRRHEHNREFSVSRFSVHART